MKAILFHNGTLHAPMAAGAADGDRPDSLKAQLAFPALVAARLALPVLLLALLLMAAYLYADALLLLPGAPVLVQKAVPAISDLILPLSWFAIHLTCRRLGAPYAFGQLVAGMALVLLVALINPYGFNDRINVVPALSGRALLAFGPAFLAANFIAIVVFDGTRGPRWWTAPLAASFAASLVFCALYYPLAFAGGGQIAWLPSAVVHFALFLAESILLLIPCWLLRPAMRPIGGLNGY